MRSDYDVEISMEVSLFFDVENMFPCKGDSRLVFGSIESPQRM